MPEINPMIHPENPCPLCGMKWEDDPIGDCPVLLLKHYSGLKSEITPYLTHMKETEDRLKKAIKFRSTITGETGTVIDIPEGRVKIIHPKQPRRYWDGKALDGFAAAHPEILEFRTEKMPSPTVRIETI